MQRGLFVGRDLVAGNGGGVLPEALRLLPNIPAELNVDLLYGMLDLRVPMTQ
ncbi:MAG: hypothetical protein QOK35_3527 [Pseudonocardiales bacterium]|nr:hypothetical protein [Pseudonocardiales bacterium]